MPDGQQPKILDQTLGEVLQSNPQAQGIVMNALKITPQQLQEMLTSTGNNPYMNMKISDMFKNGVFQQAMQVNQAVPMMASGQAIQITKEQYQQIQQAMQNGQPVPLSQLPIQQLPGIPTMNPQAPIQQADIQQIPVQQKIEGQVIEEIPVMVPVQQQKPTFFQKLKELFR